MNAPGDPGGAPPAAPSRSVGARIFRAAAVVGAANLLVKLLGLVRNQATVACFGISDGTTDAFFAAQTIALAVFFLGEECIGPAFLPIYMERRERDGPARAWRLAGTVLNVQFLLLLAAAAALALWPGPIVRLMAGWQEEVAKAAGRGLERRTAGFLAWMAPAVVVLSLTTTTFMLLNARKKFFWAAFGEGSFRALAIAFVVTLGARRLLGGWALPAGVLAGSLAKLATHLPGLRDELRHYRLRFDFGNPDFRRFLVLIAPLVVGSAFAKFRDIFINVHVVGRAGVDGGITSNMVGRGVIETLNFVVPYALSVGMFPYLCELADRGDRGALGAFLDRSSRFMLFLFLPLGAVLAVAAGPLADILFRLGRARGQDVELIGLVTACSALSMPFYAVERVMMKGYFSSRRTTAPIVFGMITSALNMAACYALVVALDFRGVLALAIVPLAAVGVRALKVALLALFLRRSLPLFPARPTAVFAAKVLGVTEAAALAAMVAHRAAAGALNGFAGLEGLRLKLALAADAGLIGLAATAAFLLAAWALRMEELRAAADWLRPRAAALLVRLRRRRR